MRMLLVLYYGRISAHRRIRGVEALSVHVIIRDGSKSSLRDNNVIGTGEPNGDNCLRCAVSSTADSAYRRNPSGVRGKDAQINAVS